MDTLKQAESNDDNQIIQEDNSTNSELSDEELNKRLKEFLNAIHTENSDLIDKIIETYQEKYDIINRVDPETGQTSIYLAAILNNEEASLGITRLLIEKGANVLYKDNYSQTAFFHVVREGKVGLINLYIQNGADMNEQDDFKQTPLFYASRDGKHDAVRVMCEAGADTNILDKVNQNALFYAASQGKLECCKILLDHKINVNQADNKKQTALFFAKKKSHTAITDLLLSHGAVNTKDGKYTTTKQPVVKQSNNNNVNALEKSTTKSHGIQSKRKKEREDTKQCYQLIFTGDNGISKECTAKEFEIFKNKFPDVAELLLNPGTIPYEEIDITSDSEEWFLVCNQILNCCWKLKGANIFHKPVDVVKLELTDYYDFVKIPMDFGSIKKKLSFNVYKNASEFISDVELVFENCESYNGNTSDVGLIGVQINKEFQHLLKTYGVKERFCKDQITIDLSEQTSVVKDVTSISDKNDGTIEEESKSNEKSSKNNVGEIVEEVCNNKEQSDIEEQVMGDL